MNNQMTSFYSMGILLCLFTLASSSSYAIQQPDSDTLSIGLDRFMPEEKFTLIAKHLSTQLNVPVKYENFNSLIELTKNQSKYDLIYTNAFGYAYAQVTDLPFAAFLIRADKNGDPLTYKSCLITNSASGITTVEQVKENSDSLDVSFTYASSTSGHIVPRIYLSQLIGETLESGFQGVAFESSHEEIIKKVGEGKTDLGACSCYWAQKKAQEDSALKGQIKILWESTPIPHVVWATGNTMNEAMKVPLQQAFSTLLENEQIRTLVMRPDLTAYSSIKDEAFSFLIDQLKKDQELEFYLYYYESFSE
ncbi:MAG: phosphate/phosphite/phosphonate ABC transporter substrate-binding protein [Reichenbachiella sp.]|uniref:phosphate/phosphite/phosphonate ABC transporter substrate-binding protein n=1 Tax=Reichenbachiella sp. TaxID=2184521 RepID=UPI003299A04B